MKKIVLLMALFLIPIAYGLELTQEQYNTIDFNTVDLDYQFGLIRIEKFDGYWSIKSSVNYFDVTKTLYGYRVERQSTLYRYTDYPFFFCLNEGNYTDIECFDTYVLPEWQYKFIVNDYMQRRYLKSLQTDGYSMITKELMRRFI